MTSFFLSFLWGIVIVLSLIGWGSAVNRLVFPRHRIDWGQKAAWGLAFSILVGGVLNLTWAISRAVILAYLAAGLLYWIFDIFKTGLSDIRSLSNRIHNYRKDKIAFIGFLVVFTLAILQYGNWVSAKPFNWRDYYLQPSKQHTFNWHDDFHAYFVFPKKMLQAGSIGPEPFSERRLVSSLGGQAFLQTFVLSMLSEKNFNLIEPGLGIIIAVGLLLGCFRNKGTPKKAAVFILLFFSEFWSGIYSLSLQ